MVPDRPGPLGPGQTSHLGQAQDFGPGPNFPPGPGPCLGAGGREKRSQDRRSQDHRSRDRLTADASAWYRRAMVQVNKTTLSQIRKNYRALRRRGYGARAAAVLALNSVPGLGHGVESLTNKHGPTEIYYLNMGDTYANTVLCWVSPGLDRAMFKLGNWGDLVETGRYC